MKKELVGILLFLLIAGNIQAEQTCRVKICNKIERWSLSITSHLKDKFGESCFDTTIGKEDAVKGKELSSESRWYQGSNMNPTKKSVTRVKEIYSCQ